MNTLPTLSFLLLVLAAYGFGVAKTGVPGIGIASVAVFSVVLPGRNSIGIVLPLLILADTFAVIYYRRHANWMHLARLFPWAAAGIVLGYLAIGRISDGQTSKLIGMLLIALTGVSVAQHLQSKKQVDAEGQPKVGMLAQGGIITILLGTLAGFATMVGNAAGPLMVLYLIAARLPKMEFVGTAAWYFFCLNIFKAPFSLSAGLITAQTLVIDAELCLFVVLGALSGRQILLKLNQRLFEALAMFFTAAAGIWLLLRH